MTGVLLYWITAQRINEPSHEPHTRPVTKVITTPDRNDPVIPSVTQGLITDDQMDAVIAKYHEDIDDCIRQGRKRDPGLVGDVDLDFEVHSVEERPKEGAVEKVLLTDTSLFDRRTARCILGMAMNWEFPAPNCVGGTGINCVAKVKAKIEIPEAPELKEPPKKKKRKKR
jgi:hypothetical protein